MKSLRPTLLLALLAALLTGCVATGPLFTEAMAAPEDAVIYVYRTRTATNSAFTPLIEVNGKEAGTIATGGYLVILVTPGFQYVELSEKGFEGRSVIGLDLAPGERAYARVDTETRGPYYVERIFRITEQPSATAEGEISLMRHVGMADFRAQQVTP